MIIYPYESMKRTEKGEKNPIDDFIDKHWDKRTNYLKFVSDLETALTFVAENYDILSEHTVYENYQKERLYPIRNIWNRIGKNIPEEKSTVYVAELFIAKGYNNVGCKMVIGSFYDIATYMNGEFILGHNSAHVNAGRHMAGSKVPSICTHWHYAQY